MLGLGNSALVALIVVALSAVPGQAQVSPGTIERTIPKYTPDSVGDPRLPIAPGVPQRATSQMAGRFVLGAVVLDGAQALRSTDLAPAFEHLLASEVGQEELQGIADAVTARYRRAGYLLSYAILPEQDVRSGIVRIRVVEGYIDDIRVDGPARTASVARRFAGKLRSERPLRSATLERALGLIRELPGLTLEDVRLGRDPADPARHQLVLQLRPKSVRGFAYADNRGSLEGARFRAYSSAALGSTLAAGDELQLDAFLIPSDRFRFVYGRARASAPLGSGGVRMAASLSAGDQWQQMAGPDQHGESRQWAAEIAYPVVKSRALSTIVRVSLAGWRSEENRAGARLVEDRYQVGRLSIDVARVGTARFDSRLTLSQGLELGSGTRPGDALASRPGAGWQFTKLNLDLQYSVPLADRLLLRLETAAQMSSRPLLASEEFALGGNRIGRAFDFNALAGDRGAGGLIELARRLGNVGNGVSNVDLYGFLDGGGVGRDRPGDGPRRSWFAGTGGGVRLSLLGMTWSAEVGFPLKAPASRRGVRAFASIARPF